MVEMIKKKKAVLSSPTTLSFCLRKPRNLVASVEVKLLETDVLNSPKELNFLCSSDDISADEDLTRLDNSVTEKHGSPITSDHSSNHESSIQETAPSQNKHSTEPSPYFLPDLSDCLAYYSPLESLPVNGNNTSYLPVPCWNDSKWCPSSPSPPSSTCNSVNGTL